jgi:hypothetical protein
MATGWFIVPYVRDTSRPFPVRYAQIDDYSAQISEAGGEWAETEVLGNRAIVKVRASAAVLDALAAVPGFRRLPKDRLDDALSDLPTAVLTAIRDELQAMGYPLAEIRERFGLTVDDLADYTLRDVLQFAARRRLKPRYDPDTDEIVADGAPQACRPIESVDKAVWEAKPGE